MGISWIERDKIEKVVKRNIKEIPWEGTEVDTESMIEDLLVYFEKMKAIAVQDAIRKERGLTH